MQAALRYPEKIRGLFLMAMPLVIRVRSPYVGGRMISAFQKNASAEISAALTESNSVRTGGIASCLGALPRFAELYFKCRKTRDLQAEVPMIVVNSSTMRPSVINLCAMLIKCQMSAFVRGLRAISIIRRRPKTFVGRSCIYRRAYRNGRYTVGLTTKQYFEYIFNIITAVTGVEKQMIKSMLKFIGFLPVIHCGFISIRSTRS